MSPLQKICDLKVADFGVQLVSPKAALIPSEALATEIDKLQLDEKEEKGNEEDSKKGEALPNSNKQ